jgi:lysozyme family protein
MTVTPAVQATITRILAHEGGIADVGDGMGVTRFGQAPAWLEEWGLPIPADAREAALNYGEWMGRTGLADLCDVDDDLGYLVTDWAVHSGLRVAVQALQRLVGVSADGVIGPLTLAAVEAAHRRRLVRQVVGAQARFFGALLASDTVDRRKWARGWLNRLADKIEAIP